MSNVTLDIYLSYKIKKYIKEHSLNSNDRLPPTRELASIYGVQRITVTEALKRLVNEGTLYAVERKGYFVAPDKVEIDLTKENPFDKLEVSLKSARHKSSSEYEIIRCYTLSKEPIAYEISNLCLLESKKADGGELKVLTQMPLFCFLKDIYGKGNVYSVNQLTMSILESTDKEAMDFLGRGTPIMLTQRIFSCEDKALGFTSFILKGDRCTFKNILNRS